MRMCYELNDLYFFTKEVLFSGCERALYNLFGCNHVTCLLILTLVNRRKLAITKFWSSKILLVKAKIAWFNSQHSNPVFNDFLVFVIVYSGSDQFWLVRDTKTVTFCILVQFYLIDEHTSQENCVRWEPLLFIVVNEKSLITKDVVPVPHCARSFTNFEKLALLCNLGIDRRQYSFEFLCFSCLLNLWWQACRAEAALFRRWKLLSIHPMLQILWEHRWFSLNRFSRLTKLCFRCIRWLRLDLRICLNYKLLGKGTNGLNSLESPNTRHHWLTYYVADERILVEPHLKHIRLYLVNTLFIFRAMPLNKLAWLWDHFIAHFKVQITNVVQLTLSLSEFNRWNLLRFRILYIGQRKLISFVRGHVADGGDWAVALLNLCLWSCLHFLQILCVWSVHWSLLLGDELHVLYYWFLYVLVEAIGLINVLWVAKTDVWEVDKHHRQFLLVDEASFTQVEDLEYVLVKLCVVAAAEHSQRFDEFFERNVVIGWKVLHLVENAVSPKARNRTKFDKNVSVNAAEPFGSDSQVFKYLIQQL